MLSLIPYGVESLELYFDTIDADNNLGAVMASRLNEVKSLKKLKISCILCGTTEEGFIEFFKNHKLNKI